MTRHLTFAALLTVLLSACGGGPAQPQPQPPGGGTTPAPAPAPTTVFIPEASAAVGTGDGTVLGKVYVSPTTQEVEIMRLVNEVRTKGTLNGVDAIAGSCVEGTFTPGTLRPLTYNGLYAYAARKHAVYMSEVGYEFHSETQSSSPQYYGATVRDRVIRAYKEQAGLTKTYPDHGSTNHTAYGGEYVVTGRSTPEQAMRAWMESPGHCSGIMNPAKTMFAAGHALGPLETSANRWGHSWAIISGWNVN